jgi:hypothetical protein
LDCGLDACEGTCWLWTGRTGQIASPEADQWPLKRLAQEAPYSELSDEHKHSTLSDLSLQHSHE